MTVYDWGVIGALVLGFVVVSWASYSWGFYTGADHERPRARGDGYREGYDTGWRDGVADGCGCPDASSGAMFDARVKYTHCRLCGKEWPDCTCNLYDDDEEGDDD